MAVLEKVAQQMQIDLDAFKKAQERANALDALAKALLNVMREWASGEIAAQIEFDDNGEPQRLRIDIRLDD